MNAFLLTFVVLGLSTQHLTKKIYNQKNSGGAYTFSAISVLAALLFFLVASGGRLSFTWAIVPHALGFALTYSFSILFSFLAIKEGPLSLTTLISSYSLLIPSIYGLIAWGERFSYLLLVGIVLLMISIFLVRLDPTKNRKKKESSETAVKKPLTAKWALYVCLSFVGGGGCSTFQKDQQLKFNGAYKNEFMIVALCVTFVSILLFAWMLEKKSIFLYIKRGALPALVCGVANAAVNLFVMILSLRMAASVMFPIVSAGTIITTSVLSMTVYKEKLSTCQKIGLLLGVMAIVVLNI